MNFECVRCRNPVDGIKRCVCGEVCYRDATPDYVWSKKYNELTDVEKKFVDFEECRACDDWYESLMALERKRCSNSKVRRDGQMIVIEHMENENCPDCMTVLDYAKIDTILYRKNAAYDYRRDNYYCLACYKAKYPNEL